MNQTTQTQISLKKDRFATKKKISDLQKAKNTDIHEEIYRIFVWQGLAVEICIKQTQIYRA